VERLIGSVKAHSWKELVEQAEIAEKSATERNLQFQKANGTSVTKTGNAGSLPSRKAKKQWSSRCLRALLHIRRRPTSAVVATQSLDLPRGSTLSGRIKW